MGRPLHALEASSPRPECRCLCGSLLARLIDGGVELKCRRCKRTHVVPLGESPAQPADRPAPERQP